MGSDELYVHFGCGLRAPQSWRNFDASPTLRWERIPLLGRLYTKNGHRFPANVEYGDISKGLPVPANACAGVFASHVLEHLALEDCRRALANTFAYLKAGGIFRLVVPDMERLCRDYLAELESGEREAVMRLIERSGFGRPQRPRSMLRRLAQTYGNSAHLWMWDFPGLSRELEKIGFVRLRPCRYGDCEDPAFAEVEEAARFDACVAIECRKPAGQPQVPGAPRL